MSLDPPPLVLDDIVHGMSPSPGPQDSTHDRDVRSPTPEQLDEEQASAMRKRALEITSSSTPGMDSELTQRETELVRMVRDPCTSFCYTCARQSIRSESGAAVLHL